MAPGGQAVLRDQVAVVTGGSRGIGAAIAEKLAKLGAMVYLTGRSQKATEAAADKIRAQGGQAMGYEADVCKWRDVEELAEFVNKDSRRCDILVTVRALGSSGIRCMRWSCRIGKTF